MLSLSKGERDSIKTRPKKVIRLPILVGMNWNRRNESSLVRKGEKSTKVLSPTLVSTKARFRWHSFFSSLGEKRLFFHRCPNVPESLNPGFLLTTASLQFQLPFIRFFVTFGKLSVLLRVTELGCIVSGVLTGIQDFEEKARAWKQRSIYYTRGLANWLIQVRTLWITGDVSKDRRKWLEMASEAALG